MKMADAANTPQIRFAGFTDAWEQRKLGDEAIEILAGGDIDKDKTVENGKYPIYANALTNNGIVGYYNDYYRVKAPAVTVTGRGEVGFAQARMVDFTPVVRLLAIRTNHDCYFLENAINNHKVVVESTGVPQLTVPQLSSYNIFFPKNVEEESRIGEFLHNIDTLITLHQRKCDALQKFKKSMLQKMFPQNGESVPEIRFAGFTDAWEQRKFGELVVIERGGSPRPIDDYITDSPDGLNWVKIGDAPEQGNYITSTKEKIRPEGLSKTREVHPGDLILSNSMSFGKPYIMAIDGCIHDGWLSIKNTNNVFDLKFLCVLLGTEQMLTQYKSMAAGSTVNNLNKELVGNTTVTYPNIEEQRTIGQFFEEIENLITLHQRKLETLQKMKKSLLQKMFV